MTVVVASVPSGHVYVRHLSPVAGTETQHDGRTDDPTWASRSPGPAVRRLADPPSSESPDSPWWPPRMLTSAWVRQHAAEFDLMHVHFGFDAVAPHDLQDLVESLHDHDKPLVVTVHDLRNPHHATAEIHDAQLGVLVTAADRLITLTPGAAGAIATRWDREAKVLPHPHVVPMQWIGRPRPDGAAFTVGLHVKSLRANMDPVDDLDALVTAVASLPGAVLRVDAHTDVMTPGFPRHDAVFADHLNDLVGQGQVELHVHDYFSDEELWAYLQGLDVSVLPYRFGTHSGWLEACHDLGTWVVAPDCGFYAQQRPVLSYAASGPERAASLAAAVRTAHHRSLGGERAPRAIQADRAAERAALARAHSHVYAELLARRRACTS